MTTPHSADNGSSTVITPEADTPRTIEDIERRSAEVLEQERRALEALTFCIREIAVRLPVESRLPLDLAAAAKSLEVFTVCKDPMPAMAIRCGIGPHGELTRAIDSYLPTDGAR